MLPRAPAILFSVIAALAIVAIALVARDHWRGAQVPAGAAEFQRLTGGLGLGPTTNPARCEFSFDPRISPDWRGAHHPVVCGEYFCPGHANSVFYLSPLESLPETAAEIRFDAGIP